MRLTIDCDDHKKYNSVKNKLLYFFGKIDEIWLSPSGNGYHFVINNLPINAQQNLLLRSIIGDDKIRIKLDEYLIKVKPFQVLWNKKGKKKAKLIMKNVLH